MFIKKLDSLPDLAGLCQLDPQKYPSLLASSSRDGNLGRYDILFAFPSQKIVVGENLSADDFFSKLDQSFSPRTFNPDLTHQTDQQTQTDYWSELPFTQGWFVYLSYEMSKVVEPTLAKRADQKWLPEAIALYCEASVVVDHLGQSAFLVTETLQQQDSILKDLCQTELPAITLPKIKLLQEESPAVYEHGIAKIQDYILDGDVFQVNLSRLWEVEFIEAPEVCNLFRSVSQHNPAPFSAWFSWAQLAVLSASPERLVRRKDNQISTRPIAGTRPRGQSELHDQVLQNELLNHPKERAEHIMLIDLERNDLGRICIPGTVKVNELMVTENYATVQHIVSNIQGFSEADLSPGEIIKAVFPGGTITGCPKVRCMEIIHELEAHSREAYTGSVGYIDQGGNMDFNILIRTMMLKGQQLKFRAGGGIVADSLKGSEVEETRAKAQGMINSISQL